MPTGYVLFIVLIFLHLFSILGLSGLTSCLIMIKSNALFWQREQLVLHAQSILHGIEQQFILEKPSCFISTQAATALSKKSLAWWRHYGCKGNDYYYVAELVGSNPCAIVNMTPPILGANYFRLTLIDLYNMDFNKIILQSVIAIKADNSLPCTGKSYRIKLGVQMQKEL